MTFGTRDPIEDSSRVGVLVTALTAIHRDGTKALNLSFIGSLCVTGSTVYLRMGSGKWVTGLFLMIKPDTSVHLLPPESVMTLLALIKTSRDPLTMKIPMTRVTIRRGV